MPSMTTATCGVAVVLRVHGAQHCRQRTNLDLHKTVCGWPTRTTVPPSVGIVIIVSGRVVIGMNECDRSFIHTIPQKIHMNLPVVVEVQHHNRLYPV